MRDDVRLRDVVALGQPGLDLDRHHRLRAAAVQVLAAAGEAQVAVEADPAEVARAQPAVLAEDRGRLVGGVVVAVRHDRAADRQLALRRRRQRLAALGVDGPVLGERAGDAAELRPPDGLDEQVDAVPGERERRGRGRLRHPVAGHELREPEALAELAPQAGGRGGRRRHDRVQGGEVVLGLPGRLDDDEAHRRDEERLVRAVALDGGERGVRVERLLQDHRAAREHARQQALDVPEDVLERQREEDPPPVLEGARERRAVRAAQQHVVLEDDALGLAARARRVEDRRGRGHVGRRRAGRELHVELVVGVERQGVERHRGRPALRLGRDLQPQVCELAGDLLERRGVVDAADQAGGDDRHRLRLAQHELQLARAQGDVDGHGDRAGARDREEQGDELGSVGDDERDPLARRHAACDEPAGEAPRPLGDLRVRVGRLVGEHERAVGMLRRDRVEHAVQGPGLPGPVPSLQRGAAVVDAREVSHSPEANPVSSPGPRRGRDGGTCSPARRRDRAPSGRPSRRSGPCRRRGA